MEYPDRLARFGFPYLETLFNVLGIRVVVAEREAEDAQVELVKDLRSIVTRFSAKLCGMRGRRKARAAVKAIVARRERAPLAGRRAKGQRDAHRAM